MNLDAPRQTYPEDVTNLHWCAQCLAFTDHKTAMCPPPVVLSAYDCVVLLRVRFRRSKLRFNDEKQLQADVESMLAAERIEFEREKILGPEDRPDFFIPSCGLAIEVKVDGSSNGHLRQLSRYARHECVKEILLICPKPHPVTSIGGKPVHLIAFWTSLL